MDSIKDKPLNVWGPYVWKTLHILSILYSDKPSHQEKIFTYKLINLLFESLPCPTCIIHVRNYVKNNNITVDSSDALQTWCFNLHNTVNARLNKKIMTYDEYLDDYKVVFDIKSNIFKKKEILNAIYTFIQN